jgi:hypothetical protein
LSPSKNTWLSDAETEHMHIPSAVIMQSLTEEQFAMIALTAVKLFQSTRKNVLVFSPTSDVILVFATPDGKCKIAAFPLSSIFTRRAQAVSVQKRSLPAQIVLPPQAGRDVWVQSLALHL